MPIYEFHCYNCKRHKELLRSMGDFQPIQCDQCGKAMEHVISAPTVHVWNQERRFPNLTGHGDGSMAFASKEDYKVHLKENHVAEASHDGLKKHKPGSEVINFG